MTTTTTTRTTRKPTTTSTTRKPTTTPATATAKVDVKTALQAISDEMARQETAGGPEQQLQFAADVASMIAVARRVDGRFGTLSVRNAALLRMQANKLGRNILGIAAGKQTWLDKHDRSAKSDAVPYLVWAPMFQAKDTTKTGETTDEARRLKGFRVVTVFDYTDTISLDADYVEPAWETPLTVGDRATLTRLASISAIPVEFVDLGGALETGFTDGVRIVVDNDPNRPVGNLISTLCHELVHHEMGHVHDRKAGLVSRSEVELEAALGEYLLMTMLGLGDEVGNATTAVAADYLSSWTKRDTLLEGHKSRLRLLNTKMDKAAKAAGHILDRYLTAVADETDAAEAADTAIVNADDLVAVSA